jgi:CRP-like cAMP-binding protein
MKLIETLSTHIDISEDIQVFLEQHLTTRTYRKGTVLLDVGQVCNCIYFVESGLLRAFFLSDKGEDTTTLLAESGDFIYSPESYLTQIPSTETIELLERSEVVAIPLHVLNQLYDSYPAAERIGRLMTEKHVLMFNRRINAMRSTAASARISKFMADYPSIYQRTPGYHVASYLGIARETLSRFLSGKCKP